MSGQERRMEDGEPTAASAGMAISAMGILTALLATAVLAIGLKVFGAR